MNEQMGIVILVLFFVFVLYQFHKDYDEYFNKYWDMWSERNRYWNEAYKWKVKYYKLKRKKKK